MSELEDIERDLIEQWNNFRVEPEQVTIQASFGIVSVSREYAALVEFDSDDNPFESRELTSDELAQLKTEFPVIFK